MQPFTLHSPANTMYIQSEYFEPWFSFRGRRWNRKLISPIYLRYGLDHTLRAMEELNILPNEFERHAELSSYLEDREPKF